MCLFEIDGDFSPDLLASALEDLVERHGVLRTSIGRRGTEMVQCVRDSWQQVLTFGSGTSTPDALAGEFMASRRGTEEVLNGAPLFQARIYPRRHGFLLAISIHHLISDEWTMALLWHDLSESYAARVEGRPARLPDLTTTYAEFAESQRAALPESAANALPFWEEVFADNPGEIPWPQPSGAPTPSTEVVFAPFVFPIDRYPSIRNLARTCRATPFHVLLSACAVATSRVTGKGEFLIATDTASREDRSTRDVMGFFVNTRMTRVNTRAAQSLQDLVSTVRESWLAAEQYRDCHIHPVLEALGEPKSMRVDMAHGLIDEHSGPMFDNATVKPLHVTPTYHYWRDLGFQWYSSATGYKVDVIHKPSRIDTSTLAAVIGEVSAVLENPYS
ncbi:condensation domain-containing protein [Actinacidiphila soli]|uniref:condensation domain-containing protein n=1 Tax=Actinacidiphila soli TaxID=2487275 RepID=UPI0013E337A8|nr:condensation domain-containing protein [Actinacidiphila soli]